MSFGTTAAACAQEIDLWEIVTLGDDGDGYVLPSIVVARVDGTTVMSSYLFPDAIRSFSDSGGFTGTWGEKGEGPGEFKQIGDIEVGPDDSFYVFDSGNQRLTVFEAHGQLRGARRFPHWVTSGGVTVLGDGAIIVANRGRTAPFGEEDVPPLWWISPDGGATRPVGQGDFTPGVPVHIERSLVPGHILVADMYNGRIRWLDVVGGAVSREFRVEHPLFRSDPLGLVRPGMPAIIGLSERPDALWMLVRLPTEENRPPDRQGSVREDPTGPRPDPSELFTVRLLAVSRATGEPLDDVPLPGFPARFLPESSVAVYVAGIRPRVEIIGFGLTPG